MKTLNDFSPEIQAKIQEYIKQYTKGVFDGQRYNDFKYHDAMALIDWNYIPSEVEYLWSQRN